MIYFITQLICLTIFSSITHTSSTPSKSNVEIDEIDDFIERILESDKFNLLADKIAEKAAEKFKVLQIKGIFRNGPSNDNDEKLNKEDEEEFTTTKITKFDVHKGNPGKIDIHAVMEKYASFPKEKIRLKYRNFIQSNSNEKPKANSHFLQSREVTTAKHISTHNAVHSYPKEITSKENRGSVYNKAKPDSSYERIRKQLSKQNTGIKENLNKYPSDSQSVEKTSKRQLVKYKDEEEEVAEESHNKHRSVAKENSEIVEYEVEEKEIRKSNSNADGKTYNGENDQKSLLVKNSKAVEKNLSTSEREKLSESDNDIDENKVSDDLSDEVLKDYDSKETKIEHSSPGNITVRREGGKLYTFETSPDYSEYHEKLLNLKKKPAYDVLL